MALAWTQKDIRKKHSGGCWCRCFQGKPSEQDRGDSPGERGTFLSHEADRCDQGTLEGSSGRSQGRDGALTKT